jgi:hypothetical protein
MTLMNISFQVLAEAMGMVNRTWPTRDPRMYLLPQPV